jgi:hypothetical protein
MLRSSRRLTLDAGVAIVVLLAAVLAAVLVLLPAVVAAIANPAAFAAAAVAFASGGVAAFVWRIASSVLRPRLMRLGGVLFGLAAAAFGVVVIRAAAVPDGLLRGEIGQVPGGVVYALLAIVALVVWSFGDPRWWSLFPLYRDRIRSAFQVTTERDRSSARHPVSPGLYPLARRHEPTLDEYEDAPGPAHLVCCAAARENGTATGIPALSFVFGPDEVRLYESEPDRVVVHSVPTDRFVDSLRRRVFRGLGARRPKSLGTVAAAVAMSGAAVSSAMGRFDMGSTNTLIAGMNVRLGAWVPNPRYVVAEDQPAKRARPNYLLKELKGWYDLADPHIYITDGGHWDNLGLVELLRRRCETIICVDASGDQPGSFSTFFDAIDLARTECAADIDIDNEEHGIAAMRVEGDDRRPATGTAVGTISYGERGTEGTGTILYMKAQVSGDLPAALIGFSHEEPDFPDYSTADQFLTPKQFRQLVLLGWETTANGLAKLSGAGALGDSDDDAAGDRADATIAGGSNPTP